MDLFMDYFIGKEKDMGIQEILSGYFICSNCEREFRLKRVLASEAVCPECGASLEEIEDDGEDSERVEE